MDTTNKLTPLQQAVVDAAGKYSHIELSILAEMAKTAYSIGRQEAVQARIELIQAAQEWSSRLAREAQALSTQCDLLLELKDMKGTT